MWNEPKCYERFLYEEPEEYEQEIARLSHLIELTGDDYISLNNRGVLFWELGQEEKAFADLQRANDTSIDDPIPHANLARFFISKNQITPAVTLYKKTLQIAPLDSAYHVALADLLLIQGNYQEAIKHYTMAISDRPDFAYFYSQRAKAFDGLNDER